MKRITLILAAAIAAGALIGWFAMGANRGWTRTSVAVKTVDEVTGLEGVTYRRQFVPGIDLLGGALAGAGFLAGASLLFRNQQNKQTKS